MKYFIALLNLVAIVFLFVNWKVSIGLFIFTSLFIALQKGPHTLMNALTGELTIFGVIALFFDWRLGLLLILGAFAVSKFHAWGNKKNKEYYQDPENYSN